MYRCFIKRLFDIFLSSILIVLTLPIMLILFLILKFHFKDPIFKQFRPGLNEKIFTIYKFKTMTDNTNINGQLLSDEQRITKVGYFMRKFSLDEILQLFNVLKGDMSFIGPRPLLVEYLSLYSKKQHFRHSLRPGITGLAQINGRNCITFTQKFRYDIYYCKRLSFCLDMFILFKTFQKVLKSDGVNQKGTIGADKFDGTN